MIRRGYCSYFVDNSRAYSLPYCCIFYDVTFFSRYNLLRCPHLHTSQISLLLGLPFLPPSCYCLSYSTYFRTSLYRHLHTGHHHAGHLPDHLVELTSTAGLAEMVTVESVVTPGQVLHRLLTLLTHK